MIQTQSKWAKIIFCQNTRTITYTTVLFHAHVRNTFPCTSTMHWASFKCASCDFWACANEMNRPSIILGEEHNALNNVSIEVYIGIIECDHIWTTTHAPLEHIPIYLYQVTDHGQRQAHLFYASSAQKLHPQFVYCSLLQKPSCPCSFMKLILGRAVSSYYNDYQSLSISYPCIETPVPF
jgi:hypothetical protein